MSSTPLLDRDGRTGVMGQDRAGRLGLEPGSVIASASAPAPHNPEVAHSIAISLKRIADAIVGDGRATTGIHLAILDIADALGSSRP